MDRGRKRVLLVEDDADTREMTAELIGLLGHEVATAASGAEALALFDRIVPDVVILDLGLPDIGGHEVAERMRSLRPGGRVKIVVLSGRSQPCDVERSRACGIEQHLVKPLGVDGLRRVLGNGGSAERAQLRVAL